MDKTDVEDGTGLKMVQCPNSHPSRTYYAEPSQGSKIESGLPDARISWQALLRTVERMNTVNVNDLT